MGTGGLLLIDREVQAINYVDKNQNNPVFSLISNPASSTLVAKSGTIVTVVMESQGGTTQTMAAKITWDPVQYDFDQAYGLRQGNHSLSPVQSINPSTGTAAVAYIPLIQGGSITVSQGRTDLFSIRLISRVHNPTEPTVSGTYDSFGQISSPHATTEPAMTTEALNEKNFFSRVINWIRSLFIK